jgi:hypothetical protein
MDKSVGYGHSECTATNLEGGARRRPSNVATCGAENTIPGIDNLDDRSTSSTLKELLEGVAQAGSWALWMGVFMRGWLDLLVACSSSRGHEILSCA